MQHEVAMNLQFCLAFLSAGITLKGENAVYTWDPSKVEEGEPALSQRLVIKNLLLGHEAAADEYNVVEATSPCASGKTVKIPIAVLKVGETRSMNPHLEFPDGPVTFKLINGKGPVHMHGLLGSGSNEEVEMDEDGFEEMYPDEEVSREKGGHGIHYTDTCLFSFASGGGRGRGGWSTQEEDQVGTGGKQRQGCGQQEEMS